MSNEKQELIQSKGRLLVVDDNPIYVLNAVRATRARGYQVDVAFDLKDVMDHLQSGDYAGVITDLQFYEEGIGKTQTIESIERSLEHALLVKPTLSDLEKSLFEPIQTKAEIKVNQELRGRIVSELATQEYASQLKKLAYGSGRLKSLFGGDESPEKLQRDIMEGPPMGYEVIKHVQEHDIPLAVVSSGDHGQHCFPALLHTGLAEVDSLMKHEAKRTQKAKELEEEIKREIAEGRGEIIEKVKEMKLTRKMPDLLFPGEEYKPIKARLHSIVLDRAILVMQEGKEQHTYNFAIDILEGKIDETRPYRVEE